ncbi:OLC1v1010761C1 [Oldenlandia corymbosa var. corymbosa]|uniref:OLC1v1010761C1 n=1 Tax=Oldenlandia corymbosa var. corymbosa TaxID=529605 RepID=A0AAV1DS11_OLDCO|nr:OLC1v1010761C1 [Oldenlandia corymbosa var. corymbosa]
MARNYVKENVPLSRFGVLVAQLESIVASASHKPPDPLLCFDLLSDLLSAIDEEPKDSILLWQRKCEDALYSLLVLGARRPVRHLASSAMANIIMKGDSISIYSRVSSLQGFLSDGKKSEPHRVAGAAQCLGELYRYFGRRITSGLLETTTIVGKLLKFNEDFVRQEALHMLKNALEGSGGNAASAAYVEAFRVITRIAVGDKSYTVRIAAARCLKAFANIGGPGLGIGEFETSSSFCVKALEDPVSSVRDSFAEALGALLALGMNPDAQIQARGRAQFTPKKFEGGLQRHLCLPFMKAIGPRVKELRVGITLSWVSFLQAMRLRYLQPDGELQNFALQAIDMLQMDNTFDAQTLACVLYILRVGVTDLMSEPTQRSFLVFLGKQLQLSTATPSMRVAALRTVSYTLKTLGEVPQEFKELLDDTIVAALSYHSPLVRVEAALTLRTLVEVDPSSIGGLISYAVTMLSAARENVAFEKGNNLQFELECLHGEAAVLAALVSVSPKVPLGYPSRLPRSVLEVSKKMLTDSSRNPLASAVEKEAGWMLLSSLLSSIPKEELEDQVFDILSLWASLFNGHPDVISPNENLNHSISVWSAAIDALTAFIKCFVSSDGGNKGILLEPVLLYLSRALSYISLLATKEQANIKVAMDVLIIKTLIAYQSLSDPSAYKSDHPRIIQICTNPFRDPSKFEESSCLRLLLDKRDASLGPWTPGRDWLEDELRSFQGGKDGVLPCLWEHDPPSFPQPETVSKMLVNQMLLCFGTMFASQDSSGMLSLLGIIEQCLKSGKKQAWRVASVTNICVGLLSGLKSLLALRPEPLGLDILAAAQSIFQSILAEGDILASQRRASSEGLGLLARLGNDIFAARLTKLLLGEVYGVTDVHYSGSIALALGSIHRSAGGMALSSLVPATVNTISTLAKSTVTSLQIWALHGLLLTIEAAGLSYVSQVQATLSLALDILLSEETGLVDLQQGVSSLINAIVAVLGPELSPGSIFFSRCKSVIAEISSHEETATLLESVRFTQQLVLFAPQAVTVHSHVQTLLPTLSSRQPTLRHLALLTLRHLIEKDPVSVIDEQIEESLFHMLDEETNTEIANLARTTIMRLLYASCPLCPSHWLSICRHMILTSSRRDIGSNNVDNDDSSSGLSGDVNPGEDDENMVSTSKTTPDHALDYSGFKNARDKHLRYRTRVFAAECLSHLPEAVGINSAHFDLSIARAQSTNSVASGDWLILHLQDLISLAYQISTIYFENMRPIGMALLSTIIDKFETVEDPDLSGHLLLEQYQAQLLSAVRTALDPSAGPILLEAGLRLATKLLTSGILSQDQAAVKRIFSLISRPLDDFNDLYYPSYAEWVSSKIKIRLLTAHASLKCHIYGFLRKEDDKIPDEYQALLPLFSKNSEILGLYWLSVLKDYSFIRFRSHPRKNWKPFLDGVQSPLVSSKLQHCLEEAWPVILQAVVFDAAPEKSFSNGSPASDSRSKGPFISGFRMVELRLEEFQFLWGLSLLVLFQGQDKDGDDSLIPVSAVKPKLTEDSSLVTKLSETVLPVLEFLSVERFFGAGFLTADICKELFHIFVYSVLTGNTWDGLAVSVTLKILQNCPHHFLESENFVYLSLELCLAFLFKFFLSSGDTSEPKSCWEHVVFTSLSAAATLLGRITCKMQLKSLLTFLLIGSKSIGGASTDLHLFKANEFFQAVISKLMEVIHNKSEIDDDGICGLRTLNNASLKSSTSLITVCIESIHLLEDKRSNQRKLLLMKLAFLLEHVISISKIAFLLECPGDCEEFNLELSTIMRHGIECFRTVLNDHDIQVQVIGLQALKSMLQKGNNPEQYSFEIFFLGELIRDIMNVIHVFLENPANKESGTVVGECLKMLMLLQALSRVSECRKCLLHLLLEAVLLVFSTSTNYSSKVELNGLRSTAIKLVSQLAQSPSSAVYFKDVLLSMPFERRQKLQDIIRASLTQDQNFTEKPSVAPLAIKIPAQIKESKEQSLSAIANRPADDNVADEDNEEDEEDDDDDWDTFQSFPASVPTNSMSTGEPELTENTSTPNQDVELHLESPSSDEADVITTTNEEEARVGTIPDSVIVEEEKKDFHEFHDVLVTTTNEEEAHVGTIPDSVIEEEAKKEFHEFHDEHHDTEKADVVEVEKDEVGPIQTIVEAQETNSETSDIEEARPAPDSEKNTSSCMVQQAEESRDISTEPHDSSAAGS